MNKKRLLTTLLLAPLANMCFEAHAMQKYSHLLTQAIQTSKKNFFTDSKPTYNNKLGKTLELTFDYNNIELFEQNVRETYNKIVLGYNCTKEKWIKKYSEIVTSLENGDNKCFSHTIRDDKKNVVSFIYGKFINEKHAFIDYAGTLATLERKSLVWQLILSIFDRYPNVDKISLEAISNSGTKFCIKYGFTETAYQEAESFTEGPITSFELTRSQAEKKVKEIAAHKKEKISEI